MRYKGFTYPRDMSSNPSAAIACNKRPALADEKVEPLQLRARHSGDYFRHAVVVAEHWSLAVVRHLVHHRLAVITGEPGAQRVFFVVGYQDTSLPCLHYFVDVKAEHADVAHGAKIPAAPLCSRLLRIVLNYLEAVFTRQRP